MQVPDDVREAELLEADLIAHTEAPSTVADYLDMLAMAAKTAEADLGRARSLGWRGDDDAAAAAAALLHARHMIGAVQDELRRIETSIAARKLRGMTATCWRE